MGNSQFTFGEIRDVVNEFFADLQVRLDAVKEFTLTIVAENALGLKEIDLLKAELAGKYDIEAPTE